MRPALRVSALLCIVIAFAGVAHAQQVGPGNVTTTTNVVSGTTTVVGGTTVSTGVNRGALVQTGGTLVVDPTAGPSPGPILFQTTTGTALEAVGGTILVPSSGLSVLTGGGHAISANGGIVDIDGGANITTTGVGTALVAINGGQLDATGVIVNNTATAGPTISAGHGAIAELGGDIFLHAGTSITTAAFNSVGLGASAAGSTLTPDALIPVTMNGRGAMGVYMHDGGIVTLLPGSTLTMNGTSSIGISADNTVVAPGTIGSGLTINLNGAGVPAQAASAGIVAFNSGSIAVENLTVTGANAAAGVWARPGSSVTVTGNSIININAVQNPSYYTLQTSGLVGTAGPITSVFSVTSAIPYGGLMANGGTVNSTGTTINVTSATFNAAGATTSQNGVVNMTDTDITTTGADAWGVRVDSGTVTGVDSTVLTSGAGGAALFFNFGPGTIDLTDTTVDATGAGTVGLSSLNGTAAGMNTFNLSGGRLISEQASAIEAQGPLNATISDGAIVTGADLLLGAFNQTSFPQPTVVNLDASTGSILTGDGFADTASVADITLSSAAHWTGAAIPVTNVTVNDTAIWTIPDDSVVTQTTTNGGLIEFVAPGAGPFHTLTTQDWQGNGGVLALNTFLGTDGSPSDLLIIDGGNAAGNAGIAVRNAGGPGAQTFVDGILVVDTINGGTTNTNAFTLSGRAVAGPFEYFLFRGGQTITPENENNWYLRSEAQPCDPNTDPNCPEPPCDPNTDPNCEPEPPCNPNTDPNCPQPPCNPNTDPNCPPVPPPPPPVIRPEVPAYLANIRAGLGMMIHTLHERIGEPQYANDQRPENPDDDLDTWWLRVVGRYSDVDPHGTFGFDATTHTWLIQGGLELADWDVNDEDKDDRVHFGAMFSYGHANTDASSLNNPHRAEGDVDGYMVGAYATWYENDKEKVGLYMDAWGQFGVFDNDVQGDLLPLEGYTGYVLAVSLESGYAIRVDDDDMLFIEPQVQIAYLQSLQDELIEENGTRVADLDVGVPLTRLGVRVHDTWVDQEQKYQPYLEFNWWHDFAGERVTMNRVSFDRGVPEDRFDAGAGLDVKLDRTWTLWANAEYQWGDHWEGVEGMVGVKAVW